MFKADGTPIQRPRAFVAKINKYAGGLFTADGTAIRNPNSFLTVLKHRKRRGAAAALRNTNASAGQAVLDTVATTPTQHPATCPTTANGQSCENEGFHSATCRQDTSNPPTAILATGRIQPAPRRGKGGVTTGAPALRVGANVVYKADGTPIRNLSAFVANIDNYEGGLFTAEGHAISNPHTFLSLLEQRGLDENTDLAYNIEGVYNADETMMWKSNECIRNPDTYEAGILTADGAKIGNPKTLITGLKRQNRTINQQPPKPCLSKQGPRAASSQPSCHTSRQPWGKFMANVRAQLPPRARTQGHPKYLVTTSQGNQPRSLNLRWHRNSTQSACWTNHDIAKSNGWGYVQCEVGGDSAKEPTPQIAIHPEGWDSLKSNIQEPSYNTQPDLPSKDDLNSDKSLKYNVGVPLTEKLPLISSDHQLIYPDIGLDFAVKNTFIELNWYKPVVQVRRVRSADGRQNLS